LKVSAASPTTRPARSANSSRDASPLSNAFGSGAEAIRSAPKVYCRIDQVKRKKA